MILLVVVVAKVKIVVIMDIDSNYGGYNRYIY